MCNRYIARRIDFHRLGFRNLNMPKFEEFTDKPLFIPPKDSPTPVDLNALRNRDEVRPTDSDLIVRVIGDEMRLDLLRWGLVPPFEPEPKTKYTTFNAKSETIATTRAYRHAWQNRQRCLIPVDAFFEWKGAKPPKQKYRIGMKDQSPFCLAGLWEKWQRDTKVLETYTIITTIANDLVAAIHDKKRMPVILDRDAYDRWLHDPADVSDMLKPYPSEKMQATPVPSTPPSQCTQGPTLFPSHE